jgi:glutaredoxin-related protein
VSRFGVDASRKNDFNPPAMNDSATASRPLLDPNHATPDARFYMAMFYGNIVQEVRQAIAEEPVVVVGMAQNPHVKRAKEMLQKAGIAFRYLEYGSYVSKWRVRLAIKLWSGWPTFPQVFVKGTLIGGADLTAAALEDGSLRKMLDAK